MTDVNRIIKVSGCHECPNKHYGMDSINCSKVILNEKDYINIDRYVKDKTLPDNCPLEKEGEAESRLKTCLAVREDELHIARLDATKYIREVFNKYVDVPMDCALPSQQIRYSDAMWQAIKLTIEQADGETNS